MEEKKLNLDAPFLSVRRILAKPDHPNESENTTKKIKTKTTTTRRRKVKDSWQETEHETLIRFLQDQSFDHIMEPSSVPGKPTDHDTLIEELDLIKSLAMVSSTASSPVNCSSSGVSEFEKNGDRSIKVSRDGVISEYRDHIMSRFLPAAKAIAMRQKKEASGVEEMKKKKKQSIALQRVSMAIFQDLNDDDDDKDYNNNHHGIVDAKVYSNDSKKAQLGFLPWFCSRDSLDVLNPVLSRIKTCQDLGVTYGGIVISKSLDSVHKTKSASPRILRSNKVMTKPQEIYTTPTFSKEVSKISQSKSEETIKNRRNLSRLQRAMSTDYIQRQETRFLVEEVKRRRNRNKNKAQNLSVSQPPLPQTPSESWLCRTLPRSSTASSIISGQCTVVSGQPAGFKMKMEQKTNSQSMKWETIVKTSYKHHDHVRYSEELNIVHPSRQQKS